MIHNIGVLEIIILEPGVVIFVDFEDIVSLLVKQLVDFGEVLLFEVNELLAWEIRKEERIFGKGESKDITFGDKLRFGGVLEPFGFVGDFSEEACVAQSEETSVFELVGLEGKVFAVDAFQEEFRKGIIFCELE